MQFFVFLADGNVGLAILPANNLYFSGLYEQGRFHQCTQPSCLPMPLFFAEAVVGASVSISIRDIFPAYLAGPEQQPSEFLTFVTINVIL
jgi:hypothetical protein